MAPILHMKTVAFEYGPISAVLLCFLLALVYVGSLYIWTTGTKSRDDPDTIKRRFIRVSIVCVLTIPTLWMISSYSHNVKARNLFTWLGLRLTGFIPALILPLLLTMILFAGPLALHYMDGIFSIYSDPKYWMSSMKNIIWIRNHVVAPFVEEYIFRACMLPFLVPNYGEWHSVLLCPVFFSVDFRREVVSTHLLVFQSPHRFQQNMLYKDEEKNHLNKTVFAPLSEEFTFRACMLPLLVPAVGEITAVLVCPLFFGVAHFHHVYEKVRTGTPTKEAILQALFQFGYTSVFGAYSAFLFLRTGHLVAPVIAHAFCNHMGFPNFQEVMVYKPPTRYYLMATFVVGLFSWYLLLYPLTTPWVYGNDLYGI